MPLLDQSLLHQNILQMLGLSDLPVERQQAILDMMTDLVEKRIVVRIMADMNESEKERADDVLTNGTDDEKTQFLLGVADIKNIIADEVMNAKEELLNEIGSIDL